MTHFRRFLTLGLVAALLAAPRLQSQPAAAPATPSNPVRSGPELAALNAHAEIAFKQGQRALEEQRFDEARNAFDTALDYFLNGEGAARSDPQFGPAYVALADKIATLEMPARAADSETFEEQGVSSTAGELTPAEMALDSQILLTPEESARLHALVASAAALKDSDVPITVNNEVLAFLKFYQGRGQEVILAGLNRSGRYIEMMRAEFAAAGLPQDLVYMALVESSFKPTAYSRANARGVWQFIASTGRMYDLKMDGWVDERSDPEKSVKAAVRFLKDLYQQLGDWPSAMAAYNSGAGRILRARRRTGRRDFFELSKTRHIPRETRGYVPIIFAAILIAKDPARYGFFPDPEPPLKYDVVQVNGPVRFATIAARFGLPLETLLLLNPELVREATPPGIYALRVPQGAGSFLTPAAATLTPEEIPVPAPESGERWARTHRVRKGQTLASIARRYRVSVGSLASRNGLSSGARLQSGQKLRIPGRAGSKTEKRAKYRKGQKLFHTVRRGESLGAIAGRYRTTSAAIKKWNGLSGNKVSKGRKLVVYYGVSR